LHQTCVRAHKRCGSRLLLVFSGRTVRNSVQGCLARPPRASLHHHPHRGASLRVPEKRPSHKRESPAPGDQLRSIAADRPATDRSPSSQNDCSVERCQRRIRCWRTPCGQSVDVASDRVDKTGTTRNRRSAKPQLPASASCPRLAHTHPPFAHTPPHRPRCWLRTPAAQ
jgi:hypothetical protein